MKTCQRCGREKPTSEFNRCVKNKDGLQAICQECFADIVRRHAPHATPGSPVVKRTSPYRRMADVLDNIERNVTDPARVLEIIEVARATYRLPVPA